MACVCVCGVIMQKAVSLQSRHHENVYVVLTDCKRSSTSYISAYMMV